MRIFPDESSLVFLSSRSDVNETISLDKIKTVRLLRPLTMRRQIAMLEERAEDVVHSEERQIYTVEFVDKEVISGETVGYAETSSGLYLFLPKNQEEVLRCYIPKASMTRFQIGLHLGEMLIRDNLVKKHQVEKAVAEQRKLRQQRIGDYFSDKKILTREQLEQAILHQEKRPILKLGEALKELGLVSDEQLKKALEEQQKNRKKPLGKILVEMGAVEAKVLKEALAKKLGIPYVGLDRFNVDHDVIKLVSASQAKKYGLMPLYMHDSALVIAFEDPFDTRGIEEIRFLTQLKVLPVMSSQEDIERAHRKYYHAQVSDQYAAAMAEPDQDADEYAMHGGMLEINIDDLATKLSAENKGVELTLEPVAESDNTLVQFVNKMILDAYNSGVSDIHIETYSGKENTRIRFRKDGQLSEYIEIPANFREAIISRIKIMALMDIANRRKPQDGKIDFQHFGPAKIELRVVTIPTNSGLEDVVMRVLSPAKPIPLESLGFAPDILEHLKTQVEHPYGLILVCGPTGSGKTTTLHSMLGYINTPARKIWTAEDPVEITQPGLRQVQVNPKIDLTFANVLRSFLRADPDVIMVGEMRDRETASAVIEASLTGHLVLSTLHTNSAPESVIRLLDLGMNPFNFADALLAVLAQRLTKTLCTKCRQAYVPDTDELEQLAAEYVDQTTIDREKLLAEWRSAFAADGELKLYKPEGCNVCSYTGYKGRIALHELMVINGEIRHLIQTRATLNELQAAAFAGGMRSLRQDGIVRVLQGLTDMTQVRAVCS